MGAASSVPEVQGLSDDTRKAVEALPEAARNEVIAYVEQHTPRASAPPGDAKAASTAPAAATSFDTAKTAQELFDSIDADKSGSVTLDELQEYTLRKTDRASKVTRYGIQAAAT